MRCYLPENVKDIVHYSRGTIYIHWLSTCETLVCISLQRRLKRKEDLKNKYWTWWYGCCQDQIAGEHAQFPQFSIHNKLTRKQITVSHYCNFTCPRPAVSACKFTYPSSGILLEWIENASNKIRMTRTHLPKKEGILPKRGPFFLFLFFLWGVGGRVFSIISHVWLKEVRISFFEPRSFLQTFSENFGFWCLNVTFGQIVARETILAIQ